MNNLDLFELQLLPYFKLNYVIFKELKRPNVNFYNIKLFFEIMKTDIDIKDKVYENTPLHYSAMYNNKELTEYLIEMGATINIQNKLNMSPLHYASNIVCEDVIEILIANGADVNLLNSNLENPLMLYVEKGQKQSIIEIFIKSGVDLNHKNYYGKTVVDLALLYNNKEAYSVLSKYIEISDI
jgi:ankyrin repeat protein